MKLDATDLRYITADEFRVLTAVRCRRKVIATADTVQVEIGSKNHEVVPSALITEISCIKGGGVNKLMGQLAKRGLIARVQNTKCE
jgi:RIO kinase 2